LIRREPIVSVDCNVSVDCDLVNILSDAGNATRVARAPVAAIVMDAGLYDGPALNADESACDFMGRQFYVRLSQLF
jgi:hypothetical protein